MKYIEYTGEWITTSGKGHLDDSSDEYKPLDSADDDRLLKYFNTTVEKEQEKISEKIN